MRQRLARLASWYAGTDVPWPSPDARLRAALFAHVSLLASAVAGGFAIVHYVLLDYPPSAAALTVAAALALAGPVLLRQTRSFIVAADIFAAATLFGTGSVAYVRDDFAGVTLAYLALIPLVCAYLAGRRVAAFWAAVALLVCCAFFVRFHLGLAPTLVSPPASVKVAADALAVIAFLGLVTAAALAIDRARVAADLEREGVIKELARAQRLKSIGTLAAGVAHEVNNPLTIISANLALVQKRFGDSGLLPTATAHAEVRDSLADAERALSRAAAIVQALVLMTRGHAESETVVDLNRTIDAVLRELEARVRERAQLDEHWGDIPPIRGAPETLSRVFTNLITNAMQAIPAGMPACHTIGVRTWCQGSTVFAEVSDTGVGIAPALLDVIFDPFFSTQDPGRGLGLGLSLCHALVTAHGGTLTVTSEVGKGSTFRVQLPASTQARLR